MNYYEILGVESNASQADIKKAYRDLVKVHHPDVGGSDERFKQISEAYETLSDKDKRQQYDFTQSTSNSNFNEFFYKFGGDFASMFNNAYSHQAKGMDIRISINITIEEVYNGTVKYIDLGPNGFNVKIPPGIRNGAKLRIKGKGQPHPINSSAPAGDAIIIVQYLPDHELIVQGDDIWMDLTLPLVDLLLGTKINIKNTLYDLNISVPKNSYEGKVLRISDKGMPIYNTNKSGSLMIKLRMLPPNLKEEQLELVKKIKELND
jgi:curved DNA-binding protein